MANVIPGFKKGKNKGTGNYKPVNITLVSRKITEKIMLGVMEKQLRNHTDTGHRQHKKGKSYLTVNFYLWQGNLSWSRKASWCNIDFSKAFNSVSYNILLNKKSSIRIEKKHNTAGEQSADGADLKGCSKWGYISLMVSHS